MTNPAGMKDLTLTDDRPQFRIDDDVYRGHRVLSAKTMQKVLDLRRRQAAALNAALVDDDATKIDATLQFLAAMFDLLLTRPSAETFNARLLHDDEEQALDLRRHAIPALNYLMEAYGLRPTQPSSPSPNGSTSANDDTSSTAGASPEESTNAD